MSLAAGIGAPQAEPAVLATRRDPVAYLVGLLGLFVALYSVWWILGPARQGTANQLTGSAAIPGGLLLVVSAVRLRRDRRLDSRTRWMWSIMTLALITYAVGGLIHFVTSYVPGAGPLEPLVPILEIATYPIAWAALAMLPRSARSGYDLALFSLDVLVVAWSVAMLTWHFVMFPAARLAGADPITTLTATMYPVADLALIYSIGVTVMRGLRPSIRTALSVAAVALAFVFVGDIFSGVDAVRGAYVVGGGSGLLFSTAWFGLALAAYLQWRIRDGDRPVRGLTDYARSFPLLPYVAVGIAFVAPALRDWNDPEMIRQHVPATGLLMALIVVRLAVTARQNASLAAAERERLAAAVDQAAEAMLTTDRTGRITYVNRSFTRITGYSAEEAIGRRPAFLREDADPAALADLAAAISRGDSWEGRLVERCREGASVELDLAVAPLRDATGAIVGSVEVARDISRERALEAQLAQAQRMEAVGRLAGGIAHDFNNILTAISGFSELASTRKGVDHDVASDLGEILKASDRAASLTRALLAFSRQQVMEARILDLNEVLAGLEPMIGVLMGEDVRVSVEKDARLGPVMTDRAKFEQVIINLAMNARRHAGRRQADHRDLERRSRRGLRPDPRRRNGRAARDALGLRHRRGDDP
jgi:PAS domain S-box-containing protein